MKLLELHLRAYGPFTDRRLDLSAGSEGLHLVYGLNEAGKSSALRALKALLYGVPERTQDTFVHGNAQLRVGGRLRGADGSELLCYRRKGRKSTLLDGDDKPIPEDGLARLLHGVDERLFERLFGIDHQTLVSGGEALLAERGREAEALFGSGMGSTRIHAVLSALDGEAAELFAPRAQKPLLNAGLSQLAETQRRLRDASLSARQWDEARKDLDRLREALADTEAQLAEATTRLLGLQRIRRTLPGLSKRAQLRERLESLADAPRLPDDFDAQRETAESKRRLARERRRIAAARLAELTEPSSAEAVQDDLLANADAIDRLREQLGSYRKAADDRPALFADANQQRDLAGRRLAAIRPGLALDEVERLRPLLGRRRKATELGGRREALETAVTTTEASLAETERRLRDAREQRSALPDGPPLDGLERAVEAARRAGDLDQMILETEDRLRRHAETCARELATLGPWTGDLASLRRAPLPGAETLRRFGSDFQDLDDETRRLTADRSEAEAERQRLEKSLRALELTGSVPSEDDLAEARGRRDDGWQIIRRGWQEGLDVTVEAAGYAGETGLAEAFEGAVTAADEIADRLRRETHRVVDKATTLAALEAQTHALEDIGRALESLDGKRRALEASWQAIWAPCGLVPLPPREMAHWLDGAVRLCGKAEEGDALQAQLDAQRANRVALTESLARQLASLPEPPAHTAQDERLGPLLDQAESRLRALRRTSEQRRALSDRIQELEEEHRRSALDAEAAWSERERWRADWTGLMTELGLPAEATPAEVSDDLEAIDTILKRMDEARGLQSRISGIDRDASRFEESVKDILGRVAPDLLEAPIGEAVPHLHQRLIQQREAKSRLDERLGQAEKTRVEIKEADASAQAADETLAELCRQAGCQTPDALPGALERARERRRLQGELQALETELIESGDGLGLEALEAEAGAVDRERVLHDLTTLTDRIEQELRPRQTSLLEDKINAERDFAAMAGGDTAPALAEEAEQILSGVRAHAERYVRLRLAGRVLREAIEQFRRQHRDPILTRASGYFARLTCARFGAVETDFDDADQPVLVGTRANGERVRVESMSTGTRDQLYLALRLATLDHYLDSADPLPFVVDDILIQFDDERARATLDALADFSARAQVILFTHHRRVVEQARGLGQANDRVLVHELD